MPTVSTECPNENQLAPASGRHAQTGLHVKSANGLKLRDRKVQRLVRKMSVIMPWLEPSDLPVCRSWAELEILATRVFAELRDHGVINGKGEVRGLLDDYRKLRATQIMFARELGMTPASRLAIRATGSRTPIDIAGAMAVKDDDNGHGNA